MRNNKGVDGDKVGCGFSCFREFPVGARGMVARLKFHLLSCPRKGF